MGFKSVKSVEGDGLFPSANGNVFHHRGAEAYCEVTSRKVPKGGNLVSATLNLGPEEYFWEFLSSDKHQLW